jgi:CheY-like chemotaxis protein
MTGDEAPMRKSVAGSDSVKRRASHELHSVSSTVAVVDDKPDFHGMLRSLCERAGLNLVSECSDERNVLAVLRRVKPSIAIVDVQLLILNGQELIRLVHRENPQIGSLLPLDFRMMNCLMMQYRVAPLRSSSKRM